MHTFFWCWLEIVQVGQDFLQFWQQVGILHHYFGLEFQWKHNNYYTLLCNFHIILVKDTCFTKTSIVHKYQILLLLNNILGGFTFWLLKTSPRSADAAIVWTFPESLFRHDSRRGSSLSTMQTNIHLPSYTLHGYLKILFFSLSWIFLKSSMFVRIVSLIYYWLCSLCYNNYHWLGALVYCCSDSTCSWWSVLSTPGWDHSHNPQSPATGPPSLKH